MFFPKTQLEIFLLVYSAEVLFGRELGELLISVLPPNRLLSSLDIFLVRCFEVAFLNVAVGFERVDLPFPAGDLPLFALGFGFCLGVRFVTNFLLAVDVFVPFRLRGVMILQTSYGQDNR